MPQSTNLNKNPYYDDFNDSKNFYKVLFKPGVTVQTRELTTLQSILQNQVEKLGTAFFKKNSVVIPGGFAYDSSFYSVEVESTHKGIDVEDYFHFLIGSKVTGKISNVTAKIEKVLSRVDSEKSTTTFYIKYQSTSPTDFTTNLFSDGEELILNNDIDLGSSSLLSGSSIAKTISPLEGSSTSVGSAAKIDDGIYFVRGFFVNVSKQTLILDQYSNKPSYRVGLTINEEIINSDQDKSLLDNSQGFSNYAAPGADRLKISLILDKKNIDDFNDENFIELFRVKNGELIKIANQTDDSYLTDILARRTFDESGNYYVNQFNVELLESLNDNLGNGGLYSKNEFTGIGTEASEDLGVLKVSSGKAYVKGYEIPTATDILSFPKPRTTKHVESSSSFFDVGNLLRINNVKNIPDLGLSSNLTLPLYDQRLVNGGTAGNQIGVSRVYDFSSHLSSYENESSQFNLHLFDIQTYSKIDTDSSLTSIQIGDHIKGTNTGSSAFIKNISGQSLIIYQVSSSFAKNESLIVNGIPSNISIGTFTNYSLDDVKSVSNGSFFADAVLSKQFLFSGPFTLSTDGTDGTITSDNGSSFADSLKVSDIIKYSQSGVGSDIYSRITSINSSKNSITIRSVSTVPNVCSGNLGVSTSLSSIFSIKPDLLQNDDPSLTAKLNNTNISNIDFLNSNVYVKVQYDNLSRSTTTLNLPDLSGTDYVYTSYNSQRYVVVNNDDDSLEDLNGANFIITDGGKNARFENLSSNPSTTCKVITTQIKSNVSQKFKKISKCNFLEIVKTKYSSPLNQGLSYSSIYGTRVEDDQISLNTSDILNIHAIFESSTTSSPILPHITISDLNSPNGNVDDLIIGELIIGKISGASAIYVQKKSNLEVYVVNKNKNNFIFGETIVFSDTGYEAKIVLTNPGDKNIVDDFILDNGQRSHFYDFGRLIRKSQTKDPSSRLTIIFDKFEYDSTDYGDLVSTNSYPSNLNKNLIPLFNGIRNTDIIDVRPKVSDYNTELSTSPFDFSSRNFNSPSNNPSQILSPNENFIFDYDFYLPRTDKLTLTKEGIFNLVLGDPSENPIEPSITNEVLDVATIISNPYVYDLKLDVDIVLSNYKRYTMSDIRNIETRVSNLEYYTTLSLLEASTKNLTITDANGFNRFKSGFFVDEFEDYSISDINNSQYNSLIENSALSSNKRQEIINLSLFYDNNYTDFSDIDLNDTNCNNLKITGNKLSLDYSEVVQFSQPFASKVVNVNPFNIITWSGSLELNPNKDSWSINTFISNRVPNSRRRGSFENSISERSIKFIRTRNINFTAVKLKPNTRFKLLFDKKNLSSNTFNSSVFPKFLEISNNSGSFQIGETVNCINSSGNISCRFRICSPNHKSGPINSPTSVFVKNPYNPSLGISTQYGPQSQFLNIDINSLSRNDISDFGGKINVGDKLSGLTSKATAVVSDLKLITNDEGILVGSIWIDENDQFTTGKTSVDLVLDTPQAKIEGELADSSASSIFTSEGTEVVSSTIEYYDPLAQTFIVNEPNGIFPTSIDVYFYTKDQSIPVELQIREVSFGTPGGSDKVISGLTKILSPSEINTSDNASVKTTFKFDTLTRLSPGEYAIVLLTDSVEYQVWVSELGSEDISTVNLPSVNKVFITRQPSLGTLFKSQNGTTWIPSPLEDLKFTLNKAEFITSGGTARFYNSSDFILSSENKLPNNPITAISTSGNYPNDGRHILVFHPNHGMYGSIGASPLVQISGVQSDILPEKLTVSYGTTDTGPISVGNTSIFSTFEGKPVDITNPGYVKISNEIIKYENVGQNQLINVTRGSYGTIPESHSRNDLIYKYEFNNVSLAKINTILPVSSNPKPSLNEYYVQVAAGSSFNQTKTAGGDNVYATKYKQFSQLKLNENLVTKFNDTAVYGSVRTITSTSVDGPEVPFVDKGFESINIDDTYKFDSPRMIPSRINELDQLNQTNFSGSRSFTLELNLETKDVNISPIINLDQNYALGSIYNINQPVGLSSYSTDSRVNSNSEDPHSFIHISNKINLEQNANSLKVLLTAYRNVSSDIRVLYKIFTNDSTDNDQTWNLFPGYSNLDVNNKIINIDNNNGSSDKLIRSSLNDEYLEYTFTIDNLPSFNAFQIKVIGSSNNQAYSPIIKDMRAIALK